MCARAHCVHVHVLCVPTCVPLSAKVQRRGWWNVPAAVSSDRGGYSYLHIDKHTGFIYTVAASKFNCSLLD